MGFQVFPGNWTLKFLPPLELALGTAVTFKSIPSLAVSLHPVTGRLGDLGKPGHSAGCVLQERGLRWLQGLLVACSLKSQHTGATTQAPDTWRSTLSGRVHFCVEDGVLIKR